MVNRELTFCQKEESNFKDIRKSTTNNCTESWIYLYQRFFDRTGSEMFRIQNTLLFLSVSHLKSRRNQYAISNNKCN